MCGPRVKPSPATLDRVARGEHEDRRYSVGAEPPSHLETVSARQHHVEDHYVRRIAVGGGQRLRAVSGELHLIPRLGQGPLDKSGDPIVVLHDEDPG